MFAELYNETFYTPKAQDKLDSQELYTDAHGKEHPIDIYKIKNDFNLNSRVEGAYSSFIEPNNFLQYYQNPNIDNHGNCESYIGNDSICVAKNLKHSIIVGYNYIYPNTLTSCGPYDLHTSNTDFSIYDECSDFRIPEEMKNNTRHPHNEMVKERLIIDKNADVVKRKPDYVIWIEEDPKIKRENPYWKEKKKMTISGL